MLEQAPADPWKDKPKLEQSPPEGMRSLEQTKGGAVCEELQPTGRTQTGKAN